MRPSLHSLTALPRRGIAFLLGVTLVMLISASATASEPRRAAAPFDSDLVGAAGVIGDVLSALPLPLLSDLSIYGVSDADLATVGPLSHSGGSDAMLVVDDDLLDCPTADFTSIQAAVTAAPPDARIRVCEGTYIEQVTIPAAKSGLTLYGAPNLQAVIKAPPVMVDPKAIVHVNGARDVTIRHFTITGPGGGGCDSLRWGVRVDAAGSATIESNHITLIRDTPFSGCQNGIGVLVGRQFEGQVGTAFISHNRIDAYQKGGVVVDNVGSYAEVDHNEIVGPGVQPTIAPNGVQVSRGASADVHHNIVTGNSFGLPFAAGTGILLFQAGADVNVGYNDVFVNDDGIALYDTDGTTIEHNYSHDQIVYDGLFAASDTAGNLFSHNRAEDNAEHDCHDDTFGPNPGASANFWVKNLGDTENKPGLCRATPRD